MKPTSLTRRMFAASMLAGVTGAAFATRPGFGAAPTLIVGGGVAGAEAALRLAQSGAGPVTLIERDPTRLGSVATTAFGPSRSGVTFADLERAGVSIALDDVTGIDWAAARVALFSGRSLAFDRIILAPGTQPVDEAIPGLDARARHLWPAAWGSEQEAKRLAAQLVTMKPGGHIVLRLPATLSHPEVALARVQALQSARPDARLTVLDATRDDGLFTRAMHSADTPAIRWLRPTEGGIVTAVDVDDGRIETDAGRLTADLVNFVTPRNAGALARQAGLTDADGWCPTLATGASTIRPEAFILGDARSDAPRSRARAQSSARSMVIG